MCVQKNFEVQSWFSSIKHCILMITFSRVHLYPSGETILGSTLNSFFLLHYSNSTLNTTCLILSKHSSPPKQANHFVWKNRGPYIGKFWVRCSTDGFLVKKQNSSCALAGTSKFQLPTSKVQWWSYSMRRSTTFTST